MSDVPISQKVLSIKAIDGKSVHQICSGQVILSLATAVKELVENSIDANATNIEIKLKDYGMDSIEVLDNGDGIEEKDYEALGLKHYTSKLREFSDLAIVDTFGFRGEALSSLCALSKLTVTTRHGSKDVGSKLEFDYDGKVKNKSPGARDKGTTVVINQLFHSLPVRHKEFQRNIKKEFSKLSLVLQAYGLISSGVKFSCVNCTEKNKKNVILSTTGSGSLMENMASIFGPKQVRSLLEFSSHPPDEEILQHFNISSNMVNDSIDIFSITGYISRTDHGCGRSSIDRQFYFVNKRPCDLVKVSRLVNEVYHLFNRNQYPFVVLDISMKSDLVDVNVTPDKRQLFIQHEKLLLAILKASLLKMFTETAGQYKLNESPNVTDTSCRIGSISTPTEANRRSLDTDVDKMFLDDNGEATVASQREKDIEITKGTSVHGHGSILPSPPGILNRFRSRFSRNELKTSSDYDGKVQTGMDKFTFKLPKEITQSESSCTAVSPAKVLGDRSPCSTSIDIYGDTNRSQFYKSLSVTSKVVNGCEVGVPMNENCDTISIDKGKDDIGKESNFIKSPIIDPCVTPSLDSPFIDNSRSTQRTSSDYRSKDSIDEDNVDCKEIVRGGYAKEIFLKDDDEESNVFERYDRRYCMSQTLNLKNEGRCNDDGTIQKETKKVTKRKGLGGSSEMMQEVQAKKLRLADEDLLSSRSKVSVPFNIQTLRENLFSETKKGKNSYCDNLRGFSAKISPSQNTDAEDELRRNITKDMFKEMEILGQFNLGFIIVKLDHDLFIIDQHATDEKYNFECLQRDHCLKGQKLIQPKSLELTAVSESILIDNIEIFRKNGFDFLIDESKPATERVKLVSLPTSKNWTFDVDDIEELIFMLSDSPGIICRPSRVRSMFASRACRMSIMVGSPLNKSQMKKLVCHMGDIEHPWNCPHGRPTMRHLINIKRIFAENPKYC